MASLHPSATIARIDGRWPSLLPSCSNTGGENERLGAGAYRGSRCRLRHGISAVGPKIPYTKKRPLGPVAFTSRQVVGRLLRDVALRGMFQGRLAADPKKAHPRISTTSGMPNAMVAHISSFAHGPQHGT